LKRLEAPEYSSRVDLMRAVLLAMSDRIDEARELARTAAEQARERGNTASQPLAEIESVVGNHEAAVEQLDRMLDWIRENVLTGELGYFFAWQGRELAFAGQYEEAEQRVAQIGENFDRSRDGLALQRQVAALVAAHRGEHDDAERLAREALTHINMTDSLKLQGDAYCDLGEVLEAAGRRYGAIDAWREALDRYERKGVVPLVRRVRERLGAMAGDAVP
jgi:tetratricopeptide (TPR) repeat protein